MMMRIKPDTPAALYSDLQH